MKFTVDNLTYKTISDTEVTVIKCDILSKGDITISSIVNYEGKNYKITSIRYNAFQYCSGLTSIIIPDNVINIGLCAFAACNNLKEVYLFKDTRYEKNAFPKHTKLIFYEDIVGDIKGRKKNLTPKFKIDEKAYFIIDDELATIIVDDYYRVVVNQGDFATVDICYKVRNDDSLLVFYFYGDKIYKWYNWRVIKLKIKNFLKKKYLRNEDRKN